MDDLTFAIEDRPHSPGHTVPWVVHADGKRRRATDEEAQLWAALREARALLAQQAEQPEAPRRGRR